MNSFMAARKDMTASQALGFLDAAGRDAFSRVTLIYSDPTTSLARYYVVLSQPGRVVVRLVLVHGTVQTAVDEALTVQQDANGHLFIHGAVQNPRARFGSGPEVVSVTVTGGQVQVVFDSDLDEASVSQAGAVTIKGVSTQVTYDSKQKTVTLAVPAGLTPGTTYELGVSSLLHDVNQRQAVPYTLSFVGPATS